MERSQRDLLDSLIQRRRELGISQAELAAEMGTTQSVVARVETPDADPRLSTVERYASGLNALMKSKGVVRLDVYSVTSIEDLLEATVSNSWRLLNDAERLLDAERIPSAYLLAELAAEEAGKILILTRVGADLAQGNKVDWPDVRRRLTEHGSKLRTIMLFDWMVHDQPGPWAAADLKTLLDDSKGRRQASAEALEALLLRERVLCAEIGPAGLSRPETAVRTDDARMMVTAAKGILRKMQDLGVPPPIGTFKRIAQDPDRRRRTVELRKELNRLPGIIPW